MYYETLLGNLWEEKMYETVVFFFLSSPLENGRGSYLLVHQNYYYCTYCPQRRRNAGKTKVLVWELITRSDGLH